MLKPKIGVLVKTSLVDYPATLACTIFLKGCNLRCPYCYNGPLVNSSANQDELVTLQDLKDHLAKRKNVLKGLVVSGGEALLHKDTKEIIIFAKSLGYKVKLDTNGTNSRLLEELISDPETKPDFIAMDIKTTPSKYHELLNSSNLNDKTDYQEEIKKSIKLISAYPSDCHEFRTVLVPTLITKKEIMEIASLLPPDSSWRLAAFMNKNCLEPMYNALPPYSQEEAEELEKTAKKFISDTKIR